MLLWLFVRNDANVGRVWLTNQTIVNKYSSKSLGKSAVLLSWHFFISHYTFLSQPLFLHAVHSRWCLPHI